MERSKDISRIGISTGINIIVLVLSIMAGWIDAIGIKLFLNDNSAFMTGRVKSLGYHIYNLDLRLFLKVVLVITMFIFGSFISTIITKRTGLRGGLICAGILIILSSLPLSIRKINGILLPMGMGCQNAATSLTPINRTTHLTGPITDLGINIAKGNWSKVKFWGLRLIGFPLGSLIGYHLAKMADNNLISLPTILIIPAIIIILTGIIQKRLIDIPLLD